MNILGGLGFEHWLMYGLGLLTGLLVGNPQFRVKFFKGLRSFLAQLSSSARSYNRQHYGSRRSSSRPEIEEKTQVIHRRIIEHHMKACPKCRGQGKLRQRSSLPGTKQYETCPDCEGTGVIYKTKEELKEAKGK